MHLPRPGGVDTPTIDLRRPGQASGEPSVPGPQDPADPRGSTSDDTDTERTQPIRSQEAAPGDPDSDPSDDGVPPGDGPNQDPTAAIGDSPTLDLRRGAESVERDADGRPVDPQDGPRAEQSGTDQADNPEQDGTADTSEAHYEIDNPQFGARLRYGFENWDAVVDALAPHERAVLERIASLTADGSRFRAAIDAALRGDAELTPELAEAVDILDDVLTRFRLPDTTVMTYVRPENPLDMSGDVIGSLHQIAEFPQLALGEIPPVDGGRFHLELTVPAGTPALFMNRFLPSGMPVPVMMAGRGLHWRVDSVRSLGNDGHWLIRATVVPDADAPPEGAGDRAPSRKPLRQRIRERFGRTRAERDPAVSRPEPNVGATPLRLTPPDQEPELYSEAPPRVIQLPDQPPRDEWSQRDIPEIVRVLSERHGVDLLGERRAMQVLRFDLPHLDPEVLREYARAIDDMLTKYPGAPVAILDILAVRHHRSAFAATQWESENGGARVILDYQLATSAELFWAALSEDVAAGFKHPSMERRPVYSAIVHEFGHVLDYLSSEETRATIEDILRRRYEEEFAAAHLAAGGEGYHTWIRQLSGYSFHDNGEFNPGEAIPEGFAEVELNGDAASEPARVIHETLVANARRALAEGTIPQPPSQLSPGPDAGGGGQQPPQQPPVGMPDPGDPNGDGSEGSAQQPDSNTENDSGPDEDGDGAGRSAPPEPTPDTDSSGGARRVPAEPPAPPVQQGAQETSETPRIVGEQAGSDRAVVIEVDGQRIPLHLVAEGSGAWRPEHARPQADPDESGNLPAERESSQPPAAAEPGSGWVWVRTSALGQGHAVIPKHPSLSSQDTAGQALLGHFAGLPLTSHGTHGEQLGMKFNPMRLGLVFEELRRNRELIPFLRRLTSRIPDQAGAVPPVRRRNGEEYLPSIDEALPSLLRREFGPEFAAEIERQKREREQQRADRRAENDSATARPEPFPDGVPPRVDGVFGELFGELVDAARRRSAAFDWLVDSADRLEVDLTGENPDAVQNALRVLRYQQARRIGAFVGLSIAEANYQVENRRIPFGREISFFDTDPMTRLLVEVMEANGGDASWLRVVRIANGDAFPLWGELYDADEPGRNEGIARYFADALNRDQIRDERAVWAQLLDVDIVDLGALPRLTMIDAANRIRAYATDVADFQSRVRQFLRADAEVQELTGLMSDLALRSSIVADQGFLLPDTDGVALLPGDPGRPPRMVVIDGYGDHEAVLARTLRDNADLAEAVNTGLVEPVFRTATLESDGTFHLTDADPGRIAHIRQEIDGRLLDLTLIEDGAGGWRPVLPEPPDPDATSPHSAEPSHGEIVAARDDLAAALDIPESERGSAELAERLRVLRLDNAVRASQIEAVIDYARTAWDIDDFNNHTDARWQLATRIDIDVDEMTPEAMARALVDPDLGSARRYQAVQDLIEYWKVARADDKAVADAARDRLAEQLGVGRRKGRFPKDLLSRNYKNDEDKYRPDTSTLDAKRLNRAIRHLMRRPSERENLVGALAEFYRTINGLDRYDPVTRGDGAVDPRVGDTEFPVHERAVQHLLDVVDDVDTLIDVLGRVGDFGPDEISASGHAAPSRDWALTVGVDLTDADAKRWAKVYEVFRDGRLDQKERLTPAELAQVQASLRAEVVAHARAIAELTAMNDRLLELAEAERRPALIDRLTAERAAAARELEEAGATHDALTDGHPDRAAAATRLADARAELARVDGELMRTSAAHRELSAQAEAAGRPLRRAEVIARLESDYAAAVQELNAARAERAEANRSHGFGEADLTENLDETLREQRDRTVPSDADAQRREAQLNELESAARRYLAARDELGRLTAQLTAARNAFGDEGALAPRPARHDEIAELTARRAAALVQVGAARSVLNVVNGRHGLSEAELTAGVDDYVNRVRAGDASARSHRELSELQAAAHRYNAARTELARIETQLAAARRRVRPAMSQTERSRRVVARIEAQRENARRELDDARSRRVEAMRGLPVAETDLIDDAAVDAMVERLESRTLPVSELAEQSARTRALRDAAVRFHAAEQRLTAVDRALARAVQRRVLAEEGARRLDDHVGIIASDPSVIVVVGRDAPTDVRARLAAEYPHLRLPLNRPDVIVRHIRIADGPDGGIVLHRTDFRADGPVAAGSGPLSSANDVGTSVDRARAELERARTRRDAAGDAHFDAVMNLRNEVAQLPIAPGELTSQTLQAIVRRLLVEGVPQQSVDRLHAAANEVEQRRADLVAAQTEFAAAKRRLGLARAGLHEVRYDPAAEPQQPGTARTDPRTVHWPGGPAPESRPDDDEGADRRSTEGAGASVTGAVDPRTVHWPGGRAVESEEGASESSSASGAVDPRTVHWPGGVAESGSSEESRTPGPDDGDDSGAAGAPSRPGPRPGTDPAGSARSLPRESQRSKPEANSERPAGATAESNRARVAPEGEPDSGEAREQEAAAGGGGGTKPPQEPPATSPGPDEPSGDDAENRASQPDSEPDAPAQAPQRSLTVREKTELDRLLAERAEAVSRRAEWRDIRQMRAQNLPVDVDVELTRDALVSTMDELRGKTMRVDEMPARLAAIDALERAAEHVNDAEHDIARLDDEIAALRDGTSQDEYEALVRERAAAVAEREFWRAKRNDRASRFTDILPTLRGADDSLGADLAPTLEHLRDALVGQRTIPGVGEDLPTQTPELVGEAELSRRRRQVFKLQRAAEEYERAAARVAELDRRLGELGRSGADVEPTLSHWARAEIDRLARERARQVLMVEPWRGMREDLARRLRANENELGHGQLDETLAEIAGRTIEARQVPQQVRNLKLLREAAERVNAAEDAIDRIQARIAELAGAGREFLDAAAARPIVPRVGLVEGDQPRIIVVAPRGGLDNPRALHDAALARALREDASVAHAMTRHEVTVEFHEIIAERGEPVRYRRMDGPRREFLEITGPRPLDSGVLLVRWFDAAGRPHEVRPDSPSWRTNRDGGTVPKTFHPRDLPEGVSGWAVNPFQAALEDPFTDDGPGVNKDLLPAIPGGAPIETGPTYEVPFSGLFYHTMRLILETAKLSGFTWYADKNHPGRIRPGFKGHPWFRKKSADVQPMAREWNVRDRFALPENERWYQASQTAEQRAWARVQHRAELEYERFRSDNSDIDRITNRLARNPAAEGAGRAVRAAELVALVDGLIEDHIEGLPTTRRPGDPGPDLSAAVDEITGHVCNEKPGDAEQLVNFIHEELTRGTDVDRKELAGKVADRLNNSAQAFTRAEIAQIKHHLMNAEYLRTDWRTGVVVRQRLDAVVDVALAWQRLIDGDPNDADILMLQDALAESNFLIRNPTAFWNLANEHAVRIGFDWNSNRPPFTDWAEGAKYAPPPREREYSPYVLPPSPPATENNAAALPPAEPPSPDEQSSEDPAPVDPRTVHWPGGPVTEPGADEGVGEPLPEGGSSSGDRSVDPRTVHWPGGVSGSEPGVGQSQPEGEESSGDRSVDPRTVHWPGGVSGSEPGVGQSRPEGEESSGDRSVDPRTVHWPGGAAVSDPGEDVGESLPEGRASPRVQPVDPRTVHWPGGVPAPETNADDQRPGPDEGDDSGAAGAPSRPDPEPDSNPGGAARSLPNAPEPTEPVSETPTHSDPIGSDHDDPSKPVPGQQEASSAETSRPNADADPSRPGTEGRTRPETDADSEGEGSRSQPDDAGTEANRGAAEGTGRPGSAGGRSLTETDDGSTDAGVSSPPVGERTARSGADLAATEGDEGQSRPDDGTQPDGGAPEGGTQSADGEQTALTEGGLSRPEGSAGQLRPEVGTPPEGGAQPEGGAPPES
ncbi:hypothetical protein AB0H50_34020, partial [Nocardia sp. NPDC050793]